jgi:hypothetical protein
VSIRKVSFFFCVKRARDPFGTPKGSLARFTQKKKGKNFLTFLQLSSNFPALSSLLLGLIGRHGVGLNIDPMKKEEKDMLVLRGHLDMARRGWRREGRSGR